MDSNLFLILYSDFYQSPSILKSKIKKFYISVTSKAVSIIRAQKHKARVTLQIWYLI
jgi:hypothetical protein